MSLSSLFLSFFDAFLFFSLLLILQTARIESWSRYEELAALMTPSPPFTAPPRTPPPTSYTPDLSSANELRATLLQQVEKVC